MSGRKKIKRLFHNKKAASVVVSTIILTAGVLAMSIAVLYWTYSMGKIGNIEYSKSTTTSSNAVGERLGYEYIRYTSSNNTLTAYVNNWGRTDNITIVHVLILDRFYNVVGSNVIGSSGARVPLRNVDTGTVVPDSKLRLGTDAYFSITPSLTAALNPSQIYYIRVVTANGRNYDGSFNPA